MKRQIKVTIEDREDGGVNVSSEDLAGLMLSGRNRIGILAAIEPAARAILQHMADPNADNFQIDATFIHR